MIYILFLLLALHLIFLLILIAGFRIALSRSGATQSDSNETLLSLIIPFRNEEANVRHLLQSLQKQQDPNFEVILVDDHSTDQSFDLFVSLTNGDPRFKVIKGSRTGKKNALTEGIASATGEIIVTSDADCVHGHRWLQSLRAAFDNTDVKLVFGYVRMTGSKSLFHRLQELEFSSVVASGISVYALGSPVYCNGANLAFTRSAFYAVGGYNDNLHIPSGDDEFLLKKIARRFPGGVKFLQNAEAFVDTVGASSWREFFQQRLRWAGKWRASYGLHSKILAVTVLLVQMALIASVVYLCTSSNSSPVLKYLLGGKVMAEFVFLFIVSEYQKTTLKILDFFILQMLYPFYVIYVGILCNFLPYHWKDRTVKTSGVIVNAR